MPQELPFGTIRSYKHIFFLSVITFGIYYLIYWFWIFRDLEEHYQYTRRLNESARPTWNSHLTMFLLSLCCIVSLYPIYMKYQLLYEHILTSSFRTATNCPSGKRAILAFLFGGLTFGLWPLICEIRWQRAMNAHIRQHQKLAFNSPVTDTRY